MKTIKSVLALSTLWIVGGCAVVPVGPGYSGYYPAPQGYYDSPPVYYTPPAYYFPSIEIGISRGWGGHRGRR